MTKIRILLPLAALLLAGCGADVASTAANVGNLQKQQLEQAKSQEAQVKTNLDQAMQATGARAASASE